MRRTCFHGDTEVAMPAFVAEDGARSSLDESDESVGGRRGDGAARLTARLQSGSPSSESELDDSSMRRTCFRGDADRAPSSPDESDKSMVGGRGDWAGAGRAAAGGGSSMSTARTAPVASPAARLRHDALAMY